MSHEDTQASKQLIEALALQIIVASASDPEGIAKIKQLLLELEPRIKGKTAASASQLLRACLARVDEALGDSLADSRSALRSLANEFAALQAIVASAGFSDSAAALEEATVPAEDNRFDLPAWVDEATFRDFLAGQHAALEELEEYALAMDSGGGKSAELKRRVHTLKGESGIVGLDDLAGVYHAIEDLLEAPVPLREKVDRLLLVKDWIGNALETYSTFRRPATTADAILAVLRAVSQPDELAPESSQPAPLPSAALRPQPLPSVRIVQPDSTLAPRNKPRASDEFAPRKTSSHAPSIAPAVAVDRDEETVALIAEFLTESGENLSAADQMLMNAERDGLSDDHVNSLFRTFHSIKGVAGFLDLQDIASLAHTSEALLNLVRQGKIQLRGTALDRVFDATEAMRRLMEDVRTAVDHGRAIPVTTGLPVVLAGLTAVIEGRSTAPASIVYVQEGLKLGEVIKRVSTVPPEAVDEAIELQQTSGRRLGEELVAGGSIQPREVAAALRAQDAATGGKIKETIKVDLERLDSLVEMIGELVIVESMVMNIPEISSLKSHRTRNYLGQLTKITRDLQSVGMRMRMVPVRGVFQKMARLVRDLSRKSGKQVNIFMNGEATEMDRTMVDQVADPLVHMVRNAIDHGLESTEERVRAGKRPAGEIRLSAYHEGGSILIELIDDGKGLDRDAILAKAKAQGIVREGQIVADDEVYDLIFAPGFSTAKQVTEISGRGVGMDVVKRNIEAMRGRVLISTEKGHGTTFKLVLPLTLAIIDGMLVECGNERYIIPTLSIVESIKPNRGMLFAMADRHELINVRGQILPLLRLDRLFGIAGAKSDPTDGLVIVVESLGRKMGLVVDDVLQQQQVVIKSMGTGLKQTRLVSGAAILSDGRVGLIVNIDEMGAMLDKSRRLRQDRNDGVDSATSQSPSGNSSS